MQELQDRIQLNIWLLDTSTAVGSERHLTEILGNSGSETVSNFGNVTAPSYPPFASAHFNVAVNLMLHVCARSAFYRRLDASASCSSFRQSTSGRRLSQPKTNWTDRQRYARRSHFDISLRKLDAVSVDACTLAPIWLCPDHFGTLVTCCPAHRDNMSHIWDIERR